MVSSNPYYVQPGQSIRVRIPGNNNQSVIIAGNFVPDGQSQEQLDEWFAAGFTTIPVHGTIDEAEVERLRTLAAARVLAQKQDRDAAHARERKASFLASQKRPVVVGERVRSEGVWRFNPDEMKGMSLDKLQVRVAEVAAERGLAIDVPKTPEECLELLSRDYVPGVGREQ